MKDQDRIIALAELDGIKWPERHTGYVNDIESNRKRFGGRPSTEMLGMNLIDLPYYLTSYDAIIPLIQKQEDKVLVEFYRILCKDYPGIHFYAQTPSQLSDALLKSTGKWKD